MAFGVETYRSNGDVSFSTESNGLFRVIDRFRVTGSTTLAPRLPPPYFVVILGDNSSVLVPTPIRHRTSGNNLVISYEPYEWRKRVMTTNAPAEILVCK